jgi:hypothetical protein
MKWVINNRDEAVSIGKTAAEMIERNFSSRDFGKKYFQYYKDIL